MEARNGEALTLALSRRKRGQAGHAYFASTILMLSRPNICTTGKNAL